MANTPKSTSDQPLYMKKFAIPFTFDNQRYLADVTVMQGRDHIQYTISPQDEGLLKRFHTQVVHEFFENPLQMAFPGATEEQIKFSEALAEGLRHFLDGHAE